MINYKMSNILKEHHGIIVHGCNCRGVMGSGLALQVKRTYPQAYADYLKMYETNHPNSLLGRSAVTQINDKLIIVSGFTQFNYGGNKDICYADYRAIEEVFEGVDALAFRTGLPVLYPKIGAGRANGDWNIISEIIDNTLSPNTNRTLFIFEG